MCSIGKHIYRKMYRSRSMSFYSKCITLVNIRLVVLRRELLYHQMTLCNVREDFLLLLSQPQEGGALLLGVMHGGWVYD